MNNVYHCESWNFIFQNIHTIVAYYKFLQLIFSERIMFEVLLKIIILCINLCSADGIYAIITSIRNQNSNFYWTWTLTFKIEISTFYHFPTEFIDRNWNLGFHTLSSITFDRASIVNSNIYTFPWSIPGSFSNSSHYMLIIMEGKSMWAMGEQSNSWENMII